jgi:UbiD family decarboxylase
MIRRPSVAPGSTVKQPDLRSFLSELRAAGELLEIDREADPDLEIAASPPRQPRGAATKACCSPVKGGASRC